MNPGGGGLTERRPGDIPISYLPAAEINLSGDSTHMTDQIKGPGGVSDRPLGGDGSLSLPGADAPPANAYLLLYAGFMAILAAGVGFAIRGGILDDWGRDFGLGNKELGDINGAGFTSFCFGIIIGGVIADKIGYGKLVIAAFLFHVSSAVITFLAQKGMDPKLVYSLLFWGTFLFGLANGTLEAVANPLVATLFPKNRTHYLNILHASWPLGLVLGGVVGWVLGEQLKWDWKSQLGLFLVPTAIYGLMFLGQPMPKSEASKSGLSLGDMFKDVGILGALAVCFLLALFFMGIFDPLLAPKDASDAAAVANAKLISQIIGYGIGAVLLIAVALLTNFSFGSFLLFVLFITHALVGAVELGTDGWIQNITGNILTSEQGKILFVWTSLIMFGLRFCADFIEKKMGLSPVALLLVCSVLAAGGLLLSSQMNSFLMAMAALAVYAVGKTFFWPTMLAVASDRFPRTGAIAISIMGGIGMLSAGLIGSAGLGYAKDRFAGEALKAESPALFEKYKAEAPADFMGQGKVDRIDAKKLGDIAKKVKAERERLEKEGKPTADAVNSLSADEKAVFEASIAGDRKTLIADAAIPATMAVLYLLMLLYFMSIGGYKPLNIDGTPKEGH